jgi:hypothetical protein
VSFLLCQATVVSASDPTAVQVDIWTLGCVLYYLWCDGAMPFGSYREEREKRCERSS